MMMRKRMSDVHALHMLFPSATIEDVTAMGMAGVTPDFVNALRNAGVRGLSASSVTALRTLGVDDAFVKRMVAAGKTGLTVDEVVARLGTLEGNVPYVNVPVGKGAYHRQRQGHLVKERIHSKH
jgi:hypothetical protein